MYSSDPDHVLSLLSKAISMDSLALLLKTEHQNNAAQLKALKEKVESKHWHCQHCFEAFLWSMNSNEIFVEFILLLTMMFHVKI